jgi:hypothetical protein
MNPQFSDFTGTQVIAGGVKLATMATIFQFYRFTRIRWRPLPFPGGLTASAYQPDSTSTVPTYSGVIGMPHTSDVILVNASEVQTPADPPKTSVPRAMLLRQNVNWWKCIPISGEPYDLSYQGSLWMANSVTLSSQVAYMDLEYTCEFKDFDAVANLPMSRSVEQVRECEKDEIDAEDVKVADSCSDISLVENPLQSDADQALDVVDQNDAGTRPTGGYIVGFKSQLLAVAKSLAIKERISVSAAKKKLGMT